MEALILSVQYILYTSIIIAIVFIYIPHIIAFFSKKNKSNKKNKLEKVEQYIQEFISSSNPGEMFVMLINTGVFLSLKKGNHGNDFPNEKQRISFMKYSTPNINEILFNLEASHEKLNI